MTKKNNTLPSVSISQDFENDPNFVNSFARGLTVIEAFSQTRGPQTMADIARLTGFSRASVRRILFTLLQLGYVSLIGRNYELTPKVMMLSHTYLASHSLPSLAQPILEDITREVGEASSMAVLSDTKIIYIARSSENTNRVMTNTLNIGSYLPAFCTSMGRAILAYLPEEEQIAILHQSDLTPFTPTTIFDVDSLMKELRDVKQKGFAFVNQELETGLCSLAVPIFDRSGKVIAAINISTHSLRTDPDTVIERFLSPLLRSSNILKDFV